MSTEMMMAKFLLEMEPPLQINLVRCTEMFRISIKQRSVCNYVICLSTELNDLRKIICLSIFFV